ncbi:XRE family transcriptional regulator [Humibacter sp. BT305]|nr:XRE family transcriptional regulator [Humibacter sp. BT305]
MTREQDLSQQLREFRRRAGITIEELAERSGVSVRAIGDVERGVRVPRVSTLRGLEAGLGLSEEDIKVLYGESTGPSTVPPEPPPAVRPSRLGDFTGRTSELAAVAEGIQHAGAVVVITGSAGFGKTTLAVEAASRMAEESLVFVDLGGLGRPTLTPLQVMQSVLRQVDAMAEPVVTLEAASARWMLVAASKHPIVLLDNVQSEEQVRPLFSTTDRGPIVLTSRRTVSGITATTRVHVKTLDEVSSIHLLEQIIPVLQRRPAELEELARLCQGVPLALRIAANRIASRPATHVADFVERLRVEERRLSLLVAGDMSVEAALATSYEELDETSAALFTSLSLIEGTTFSREIAAAAAGMDAWDTEETLEDLVDVGLVEAQRGARYRLHDLIRVFAGSRLRAESSEDEITSARERLTYSLLRTLLTVGRPPLVPAPEHWPGTLLPYPGSGTDAGARSWAPAEQDHWWAAVNFAAERGDHEAVLLAAAATESRIAPWRELPRILELQQLALRSAEVLDDARSQALVLSALTWGDVTVDGDPVQAMKHAARALAAATESGDAYAIAKARYVGAACSVIFMQDLANAEENLRLAIDGFAEAGSSDEATEVRAFLGAFYSRSGRLAEGITELTAAIEAVGPSFDAQDLEPISVSNTRGSALQELTTAHIASGQPDLALSYADWLLTGWAPESDFYQARARAIRATALAASGRHDDARAELSTVDALLAAYPTSGQDQMVQRHIAQARGLLGAD